MLYHMLFDVQFRQFKPYIDAERCKHIRCKDFQPVFKEVGNTKLERPKPI